MSHDQPTRHLKIVVQFGEGIQAKYIFCVGGCIVETSNSFCTRGTICALKYFLEIAWASMNLLYHNLASFGPSSKACREYSQYISRRRDSLRSHTQRNLCMVRSVDTCHNPLRRDDQCNECNRDIDCNLLGSRYMVKIHLKFIFQVRALRTGVDLE